MRDSAYLMESELLTALSMVFTGVADLWYGCYRKTWRTWEEFCVLA